MKVSRRWRRFMRTVRLPFEWIGILAGVAVFAVLPRRAMLRLCDFLSAAMYRLDRRGRKYALANLRVITGDYPVEQRYWPPSLAYTPTRAEELIIRRSYRNMARSVGHAFWTCFKARARVAKAGELDERARRFLSENRPAVTVSGHIGCWEILSQLAYLHGHRMMSVAKNIGTSGMTDLLMKARTSIGQEIVRADGGKSQGRRRVGALFRPSPSGICRTCILRRERQSADCRRVVASAARRTVPVRDCRSYSVRRGA